MNIFRVDKRACFILDCWGKWERRCDGSVTGLSVFPGRERISITEPPLVPKRVGRKGELFWVIAFGIDFCRRSYPFHKLHRAAKCWNFKNCDLFSSKYVLSFLMQNIVSMISFPITLLPFLKFKNINYNVLSTRTLIKARFPYTARARWCLRYLNARLLLR